MDAQPELSLELTDNPGLPSGMKSPEIFLGSLSNPASDIVELEFEIQYDTLTDITDFAQTSSAGSSFLNPDGNCQVTLTNLAVDSKLRVKLQRVDSVGQSGYGFILRLGGIGIIDNIDAKTMSLSLLSFSKIASSFKVSSNPSQGPLQLHFLEAGTLRVLGLNGQVKVDKRVSVGRLSVETDNWPKGLYLVYFEGKNGRESARWLKQ